MTWWQWLILAVAFGPAAVVVAVGGWVFWIVYAMEAWRGYRRWVEEQAKRVMIVRLAQSLATGETDGLEGMKDEEVRR